ncbi:sensor histidine kinase [Nonomuraea sp. NPDC003804]|uniref:sensor histidine kinase n=1 Tax=Nonomuraea sp. NPDC003804 TaxID=3154547 RepID=UPI0033BB9782
MVRAWVHRRVTEFPHAFIVAGALLTLVGVAESILRARGLTADRPAGLPVFILLGLATTLPLTLLRAQPAVAAVVVSGTAVLSLTAFETLTVAGACAQLVAGFRLGRGDGRRWLALVLAAPFPLLALLGTGAVSDVAPARGALEAGALGTGGLAPGGPGGLGTDGLGTGGLTSGGTGGLGTDGLGTGGLTSGGTGGLGTDGLVSGGLVSGGFGLHDAAGMSAGGYPYLLVLLLACLAPAAALAGVAWRARGDARESGAARQAIADTLLEHTARGERARIARELHDVVAHHISLVAVQAETARLATPGMPAAGAERLSAIGDTARAALTEMRRLLGVLREDAETTSADWHPQPGLRLSELNELVDESRQASGTATRLILRGDPVELDPGVELAAYRIIQEALTNARRHAAGAAVDVELRYTGQGVLVRVRDNGPGPSPDAPAAGHGLSGMRERAAAVGGELSTGPAPGGGFLVEARLPGRTVVGR